MVRNRKAMHWRSAFFGALVVALLLAAAPVIADIGDPVLQGRFNTVDKKTTLAGSATDDSMLKVTNLATDGTGIQIQTQPGQAPLVINRSKRVRKLNADFVDGLSSEDFQQMAGSVSCAGTHFTPYDDAMTYNSFNSLRYRTSNSGNGRFRCSIDLPHGSTVTAVHFGVEDSDAVNNVSCAMWRTNIAVSIGNENNMASASTTGQPGATRVSDTSISTPLVDNDAYAYFAQCLVGGTTTATGIYGVTVEYGGGAVVLGDPVDAPAGQSSG